MGNEKPSKINKIKAWLKKHITLVLPSILVFVCFCIVFAAILFGVAAVFKPEVLTALIEAEATITGFFGIILTYALTALDNRRDKLEDRFWDLAIAARHNKKEGYEEFKKTLKNIAETFGSSIDNVREKRNRFINNSIIIGIFLTLSLILSILASGIFNVEFVFAISSFSMLFLLFGILGFFLMIYSMKERTVIAREETQK
jgi:NTP pyrophosphatase (non-canonical NTP hydrolase)